MVGHLRVMENMNIFTSIGKVTSRIEPFHSQFLSDVLTDSSSGNRDLFDKFWRLAVPDGWDVPSNPNIEAEKNLGTGHGRIDVCIRDCSTSPARILGIEIKTTDSSATPGQLERYRSGLANPEQTQEIAIAYLTPFNRERAGEFADQLPTVREFDSFSDQYPNCRHLSWLDVAEIEWDGGNQLWQQHREFIFAEISSYGKLKARSARDRSFNEFFGDSAADEFWDALKALDIESSPGSGAHVDLSRLESVPAFVGAFELLIHSDKGVARERGTRERFTHRDSFLKSKFGHVHEALFALADRYKFVWVQGVKNYGLRVAHTSHGSGVSLVRSIDEGHLLVGEPR